MKISLITLGCKLNYAETSTYERELVQGGAEIVPWNGGRPDFCLVNTCSVTEHSDKKSRNIIRKLHRTHPAAIIVVTGCSAELRRSDLEKLEAVGKVFGCDEKDKVVPWILDRASGGQVSCGNGKEDGNSGPQRQSGNFFRAFSSGERTRSFLKVQDGCSYKCHYCTVPYARGESRSPFIADIVEDAETIAGLGIREVVLTGVNIGDFGSSNGENFLDLLKALDAVDGIERYRISSIEPNLLTEEAIDWIASGSKVLPHFHIPLQSGCDTILEKMGRRYRKKDFLKKINYIRAALEGEGKQKVFLGIDVIAGFPGESDELFEETFTFLRDEVKPAFIHIFPYSRRPGTPAATMPGQVQESVTTGRVERLENLCAELHSAFIEANRGVRSKVLFETLTEEGNLSGWSENYIKVERNYGREMINQISEETL